MSSDEILIVSKKEELLSFGYLFTNVNKEVIYDGQTFILKQCGIRNIMKVPFMIFPNPNPIIRSRKPLWNIKIGDITLVVNDII